MEDFIFHFHLGIAYT